MCACRSLSNVNSDSNTITSSGTTRCCLFSSRPRIRPLGLWGFGDNIDEVAHSVPARFDARSHAHLADTCANLRVSSVPFSRISRVISPASPKEVRFRTFPSNGHARIVLGHAEGESGAALISAPFEDSAFVHVSGTAPSCMCRTCRPTSWSSQASVCDGATGSPTPHFQLLSHRLKQLCVCRCVFPDMVETHVPRLSAVHLPSSQLTSHRRGK